MRSLDRAEGRRLFGHDPATYDRSRPAYPAWIFDRLADECGLAPGARLLEIGAGTGKATVELIARGADAVVAVEPNARLAAFLRKRLTGRSAVIVEAPFEVAVLSGGFDLAVCGTAFHWLDENEALAKAAALLRPGGWWAAFWNVFGDPRRADPFHEATKSFLAEDPKSVALIGDRDGVEFSLDKEARFEALERSGHFDSWTFEARPWEIILGPDAVADLYSTFSTVTSRSDRTEVLQRLRHVASRQYPSGVTRNMISSLILARRL